MDERYGDSRTRFCKFRYLFDRRIAAISRTIFVETAEQSRIKIEHRPSTVDRDLILDPALPRLKHRAGKPAARADIPEQIAERESA
jgi:hypothetical protein